MKISFVVTSQIIKNNIIWQEIEAGKDITQRKVVYINIDGRNILYSNKSKLFSNNRFD